MIETILSYFALASVASGSVLWLARSVYKATVYLEKIENTLEELCKSMKQLEKRDSHHENRISDIEGYLTKKTEFNPKRYF
jgi:hypothetical protein